MSLAVDTPAATATTTPPESYAFRVAVCPLCHTPEPTVNQAALDAGGRWTCRRCSQAWDGSRLATVAAYAVWAAEHDGRR
jgi:ribosomal protein L37AE/L43A